MSGYLHLTYSPIPPLATAPSGAVAAKAIRYGKPQRGLWFAPGNLWIRRMARDEQWDINAESGTLGRFPYTLKIFDKIMNNQTIRFGVSQPTALPLDSFEKVKTPILVYDFPLESAFSTDIGSPSKDKVLKITSENIDAFERAFFEFYKTPRTASYWRSAYGQEPERDLVHGIDVRVDRYIRLLEDKQFTTYLQNNTNKNPLIRAAVLTLLRKCGVTEDVIDRVYAGFFPTRVYGSIVKAFAETLDKTRNGPRAQFLKLLNTTVSGLKVTNIYNVPDSTEFKQYLDTLYRLPKNTQQEMVDNLDWILCYEYGLFTKDVIERNWGGIYFDSSVFPDEPNPWYFLNKLQRNNFATLYAAYPRLIRFPFLQWYDVASGCVWAKQEVFKTETLTPKFSVALSNTPITSEDPTLFVAGIDATTKDVFFFKSGTMRGGRGKTTRRVRKLKKSARKIR